MKGRNLILILLSFIGSSGLWCAPAHYDIVNNDLQKIDQKAKPVDRKSSQQDVNRACSIQKTHIIAELKKAKPGSQAREQLLKDQTTIEGACSVLESPVARKAFHDQIDKEAQQKKDAEKKAEESKGKPEEKPAEKPKEGDPGFINDMKKFLAGEFDKLKQDADAKIFNLVGNFLSKINIPSAAFKIFNNDFQMRDMKFLKAPSGPSIRSGLGFTGITQFNKFAVQATVYVIQDTNKNIEYSLGIELPEGYKISDMFPKFTKVDALSLPKGKFVASTFKYTAPGGFSVEKGFNFIATMDLTGPLRALGELRKRASKYDFIIVDMAAPIYLQGVIDSMTDVTFKGVVPMRLGVDFVKAKKIPAGFSKVFNKITTDDMSIGVVIKPLEQRFNAQAGIQIVLGSQPQTPLRFQAIGGVDILSGKINIAGKMPDMLELNFIAIGETMVELYWDPAVESVLALFGVPVSGIALGGRIDLGKPGDTRASLNAKGKLSLETKKAADFVLEVEGKNIQFAEILSLVTRMAEKSGIKNAYVPPNKFPTMTINRIFGKAAPWDTEIAGEKIPAGFQLNLDTQLFDKKFVLDANIKHTELSFAGKATMSDVAFKVNNRTIMTLSGPGVAGGPEVSCNFNAKKPLEGSFKIAGTVDVPPLALKNTTDFEVSAGAFKANFETEAFGFTTVFGISLPAKEKLTPEETEKRKTEFEARKKEIVDRAQKVVAEKQQALAQVEAIKIAGQAEAIKTAKAELAVAQKDLNDTITGYRERQPSRWEQTYIKFGFKGDFQEFLSKQAVPALQSLKKDAEAKLAQVDKKIGELAGELEKLKQQQTKLKSSGSDATRREINKTRNTINLINRKIAALRKECDNAPLLKKTYICPKVGAQITAQGTALAAQETYLNTLLRPGKVVIEGTLDALNKANAGIQKASTTISEAKIFQKSVSVTLTGLTKAIDAAGKAANVIKVTEAIGEVNAVELGAGKLPKLTSLKAEVNIPGLPSVKVNLQNLQFDFKKPKDSALQIATQLIKGVQIG